MDHETNLVYFGKRYYDPFLARWMSTDPAGFKDALNLYQYALNNPFKFVDPNGEFAFALPLLMWGVELIMPSLSTTVMPIVYPRLGS